MQLIQWYPWLKAVHVAFMVTWFAGLFYLPRLFIYHSDATDEVSIDRFEIMERRLYAIMSIGAVVTIIFGLLMLWANPGLLNVGWFRVKILLLVALIIFHERCRAWMTRLGSGYRPDNTRWLRWFNEIPAALLLAIVILAVVKPF